jgi:uncharacterized protein DUF2784
VGYSLLADLVVLVHAMFAIFVVFGGVAVLRWPWVAWLHLPAAIWGGVIELKGWICPLTHLEIHFRRLGGEAGYEGDFIGHYLEPLLYPLWLTPRIQAIIGIGILMLNSAVYFCLWRKESRKSLPVKPP